MRSAAREISFLTVAVGCAALTPAPAQEAKPPSPPKEEVAEVTWPEISRVQKQKIQRLCRTLKTTKKVERRDKAEAELIAIGSGVAPVLIDRLTDFPKNINEPIGRVLDRVTRPEHAPLLAALAADQTVATRSYVVRRLTSFRLPAMAPVFRHARKDRDASVSFLAALGMASAGDSGSLDEIFERAMTGWKDLAPQLAVALPGVRGTAATQLVLKKMRDGGDIAEVTGLRLLRSLAERSAAGDIAGYLDSESHNVKKAAINALRVIVDKAPPLEELSVFQAIEMANQWKARAR